MDPSRQTPDPPNRGIIDHLPDLPIIQRTHRMRERQAALPHPINSVNGSAEHALRDAVLPLVAVRLAEEELEVW